MILKQQLNDEKQKYEMKSWATDLFLVELSYSYPFFHSCFRFLTQKKRKEKMVGGGQKL